MVPEDARILGVVGDARRVDLVEHVLAPAVDRQDQHVRVPGLGVELGGDQGVVELEALELEPRGALGDLDAELASPLAVGQPRVEREELGQLGDLLVAPEVGLHVDHLLEEEGRDDHRGPDDARPQQQVRQVLGVALAALVEPAPEPRLDPRRGHESGQDRGPDLPA